MQLRYDDDFVEGAVFTRANSHVHAPSSLQVRRFHRERESLYAITDPDERNTAFFKLHLEWFREWALEKFLLDIADEFPLLRRNLAALVFRRARVRSEEGAELYVSQESGWAGVLALCAERFEQPSTLARFLRHEFTHLHDMVDPVFDYSPHLDLPGLNAAQQRLTRERYRLLWDITIDGRLCGNLAESPARQHRLAFDCAFDFWPEHERDEVFERLWTSRFPRHGDLLAIASDPRSGRATNEPQSGMPCPLCGFPTFDWVNADELAGATTVAIKKEFPQWSSEQGVCGRCVKIYRHMGDRLAMTV